MRSKNLREEVAMDVDDDDATQRPKQVANYGIEVDFDMIGEDDRTVRLTDFIWPTWCQLTPPSSSAIQQKHWQNTTPEFQS
jgi:hypothetical protein